MRIVVFTFAALIILLILISILSRESLLIYRAELTPHRLYFAKDDDLPVPQEIYDIVDPGQHTPADTLYLSDAFKYSQLISTNKNLQALVVNKTEKHMFFMTKSTIPEATNISYFLTNRLPITYTTTAHIPLIKIILAACNLDPEEAILSPDTTLTEACHFHFEVLTNPTQTQNKKSDGDTPNATALHYVEMDNLNTNILFVKIPFAHTQPIDMSLYYPEFNDKFPTKTVISMKTIFYGHKRLFGNPLLEQRLKDVITLCGDFDDTNYFTKYFTFSDLTLQHLKGINKYIQDRSSLPILEQFQEPTRNIPGFYEASTKQFTLTTSNDTLDGIPIDIIPTLSLKHQEREEENGVYTKLNAATYQKTSDITEDESMLPPGFKAGNVITANAPINLQTVQMINDIPITFFNPDKDVIILKYQSNKVENGVYVTRQGKLQKIQKPLDLEHATRDYICFGDDKIKSQGLCNSSFDALGEPKKEPTYWDKPCMTNEECPYYQANKHYRNYRGGCNNGYCEMPLGVKRNAFKLVDPSSKPICHGGSCDPIAPDYAFELDDFERAQNVLKR